MKKTVLLILAAVIIANSSPAAAFDLQKGLGWLAARNYSSEFVGGSAWALAGLNAQNSGAAAQNQIAGVLKADLNNNASWSWSEADLPSAELWALLKANNARDLDLNALSQKLSLLKGPNGGFKGLSECIANCTDPDWTKQVWQPAETTTDTALALLALKNAGTLDEQTKNAALGFIYSLQNEDGSFNQTAGSSETQLYSLGPDLVSTTSLALMALEENGAGGSQQAANALGFLKNQSRYCFGNSNKVYGPALASLAFEKSGVNDFASASANYAGLMQKQDGGFADPLRSSQDSNTMDTGAALGAAKNILQNESSFCAPLRASLSLNSQILAGNAQLITANVEGAIAQAELPQLLVTLPNGTLVQNAMQKKNESAFETSFSQTRFEGNYTALLVLKPLHGSELMQSSVFQVENPQAMPTATPSPTAAPTPTPTPTPWPGATPTPQVVEIKVLTPPSSPSPVSPTTPNQGTAQAFVTDGGASNQQNLKSSEAQQPSSLTGLAVASAAQPAKLLSLSVGEDAISLSVNPLLFLAMVFIALAASIFFKVKTNARG